jgi:cytochrome c oxidase subunit 2
VGTRARLTTVCAIAVAACVGGCGGGDQSTLAPHSKAARDISTLWWWMLGVAGVVFLGAIAMLLIGWLRRSRPGLPLVGERESANTGLVVTFGMVVPAAVLVALFAVSDLYVIHDTEAPKVSSTQMTIKVIGHQWWWEVRYPGGGAVTANEIHIPVRTRVNVVGTTADVIHSFWVPELNRKIDLLPGRTNRALLYADKPGSYRGQCAEFCGDQHAHMALEVYAQPPAAFRAWLANMRAPRRAPATPSQRRGEQVFLTQACSACHTIRGTSARGTIGPDLTHLASRATLAAATIPNRRDELGEWIADPQHVKPGNRMPGLHLSGPDFQSVLDYLQSLR